MQKLRNPSFGLLLLNLIFLLAPTIAVVYQFLSKISSAYAFIEVNQYNLLLCVVASMGIAFTLYYFRLRFWLSFLPLLLFAFSTYKGIESYSSGEFDTFYLTIQTLFFIFTGLLCWLIGYALATYRYFPQILSVIVVVAGIIFIASKDKVQDIQQEVWALFPVIVYGFYTIFTKETLENIQKVSLKSTLNLSFRLALFVLLLVLTYLLSIELLKGELKAAQSKIGSAGKSDKSDTENMLKNKDNEFEMNEYAKLKPSLENGGADGKNDLLFVAFINNYFPGTVEAGKPIPNPLYLVMYHFNKYDVKQETFRRDPVAPFNDNYLPNPTRIPMFLTHTDSTALKNSMGFVGRKLVETEVYSAKLKASEFTAPAVAFACKPIAVEKDYKKTYNFAYKATSYVSELNSAYFLYNPGDNKEIQGFQNKRRDFLRNFDDYKGIDSTFMNYYIQMPKGTLFDSIADLAKNITRGKKTTIDKIEAIKQYFAAKDENGKAIFKYTLKPGKPSDPNIPSSSMLRYFLFFNKKGYCTYYAGASVFMLKSLGIPCRMTAGFLTEDRSTKNPGWYWYYAKQAHAWTQVYFPAVGWLDFDFTVGEEEQTARQSPQPDGTPPKFPPKAWYAGTGSITSIDTAQKTITVTLDKLVFKDKDFTFKDKATVSYNIKSATIKKEKFDKTIYDLQINDSVTAVSFDAKFQTYRLPNKGESGSKFIASLKQPVSVDELYIITKPIKPVKPKKEPKPVKVEWEKYLLITIVSLVALVLLLALLLPLAIYLYYHFRALGASNKERQAYYLYKKAGYFFNQIGFNRGKLTPMQFANQVVDAHFEIGFKSFMNTYLKIKFSNLPLNEADKSTIGQFAMSLKNCINKRVSWKQKIVGFINIARSQQFFVLPPEIEEEAE